MDQFEEKDFVRVATMYYDEGMTQAEIAKKLGVSRSLISKILIDARNAGIVEVFINSKSAFTVDLERQLEKKYDLQRAIVIDTLESEDSETEKMASRAAALYLQKISKNVKNIGVSWGNTLRGVVDHYPYTNQPEITVFPLVGGMGDDHVDIHSNQLCYDLARKMRGKSKYLYAPALVSNKRIKEELSNNATIRAVIAESKLVDIALVGLSTPYENSTMVKIGYINEQDLSELSDNNVVGDINSRFFDVEGKEAKCRINQNVMGINLNELRKIKTVMAVAYGESKYAAIKVALNHHLVDVIVTTDKIATKLLAN